MPGLRTARRLVGEAGVEGLREAKTEATDFLATEVGTRLRNMLAPEQNAANEPEGESSSSGVPQAEEDSATSDESGEGATSSPAP